MTAAALAILGLLAGATPTASASVDAGPVTAWGRVDSPPASLSVTGATAIAAGQSHGLALTPDGVVVAWGDNPLGETSVPASLSGRTVTAISAGLHHSLALTSDGQVTAWGYNQSGQATVPASLSGRTVTAISSGWFHNLALTSDGLVIAWGDNGYGQTNVPASLSGKMVAISAGGYQSLALTADGKVKAWGRNSEGQASVPASLAAKTVTAISAGGYYNLALTSDGQITAWGNNGNSELNVPTYLASTTVTATAAGASSAMALTSDGRVIAWGDNEDGLTNVPGSLTGRTVTAIAAGQHFDMAITRGGLAPVVTSSPRSVVVHLGARASFTATATGSPSPTVQWQRGGPGGVFTDVSGATGTTYAFTPVAADDGATFRAVFTNPTGIVGTDTATLTVSNSPPTAKPLVVTADFESATPITLSGTDPDADPLTYTVATQPKHGLLSGTAPALTYTPDDGYSGTDSFTYRANDASLSSAVATVSITVSHQSCVPATPKQKFKVDVGKRDMDGLILSPKFQTKKSGEVLVAFFSANGPTPGAQKVTGISGGGLTWTLVQRENDTGGSSEIWQAYAAKKLKSTRITAHLAVPGYNVTMTVAGFSGARPIVGAAAHHSGTHSAPQVSLTPQSAGSVVWAVGRVVGSRYHPKPISHQKVVHVQTFKSPNTGNWTQRTTKATTSGTKTTVSDKTTANVWGYTAVEIRGTCG